MAHETAQILGMGCRVLFHNGIFIPDTDTSDQPAAEQ